MNKIKISSKILGIVALLFVSFSCQKEDDQVVAPLTANEVQMKTMAPTNGDYCGIPTVVMLTAGQHIDAGTVTVGNDENYIYVTYSGANGYKISETHLYIGAIEGMPVNKKGNPKIGQFPYGQSFNNPVDNVTYQFNISDIDNCFIVAAHAVVVKYDGENIIDQQTAWGAGDQITDGGSWAMYFDYCVQECSDDPWTEFVSETAFAYGADYATCFLDWGFNRWGWSNRITQEGQYTFEIWAAAGQCDLSKGTLVGNLFVNYSNGVATVSYSMDNGFTMLENHLYVGTDRLPMNNGVETVAPGQYPIVVNDLSDTYTTYTVNNLTGPIYIVAHATVGWYVGVEM
ncbi:MAG: hypothetical protein H5T24_05440 [Bacteroidales bacterium]|nr:hypothetical protein [Bacteroidales bacterium]